MIAPNGIANNAGNECKWCVDSVTSHMLNDKTKFDDMRRNNNGPAVSLANNASPKSNGRGTVRVTVGEKSNVTLKDILFIPNLRTNLMSVAKIMDNGFEVIFRKRKAVIVDARGNIAMAAKRKNDLYFVSEAETANAVSVKSAEKNS